MRDESTTQVARFIPHPSALIPVDVLPQPLPSAFPAESALAIAAEAGGCVEEVGAVDPDGSGFDLWRDVQGEADVFGPDAGGEAVSSVVRQLDGFVRRAEGHRDDDRAEDLYLCDRGGGGDVREEGGRVEAALLGAGPGGLPECR